MMTLTIEMPDEVAERARAVAHARGLYLNTFAVSLFRAASLTLPITETTEGTKAATGPLPWDDFAALMVEGMDPHQPPLPDYALTRESIYEDCSVLSTQEYALVN